MSILDGAYWEKEMKPATNADHIRQMTDEELAIFLSDVTSNAIVILGIGSREKSKSAFDWYTWLTNPAEEGEG